MTDERVVRLREICAGMPGVEEGVTVHHPSFKLRGKAIVMVTDDLGLWVKSDRGTQAELIASVPGTYFVPPYVGHHGWVGVRVGPGLDWAEVAELVTDTYRAAATSKQLAEFDARR